MRKDHRPYFLKKADQKFQKFYVNYFLRPHFDFLGRGATVMKPWNVEVFGEPVELGNFATIIATSDNKIRLSVWSDLEGGGQIKIGDYSLICPGVRLSSRIKIAIGDNCMIASNVYITDSDWHGVYNRVGFGESNPVIIKNNVWIGDSAIVMKGVTIGENSIIGAGSIVIDDIPENSIAAGNPAKVVKLLDPDKEFITRAHWFKDPSKLSSEFEEIDRKAMEGNTVLGWIRSIISPRKGD